MGEEAVVWSGKPVVLAFYEGLLGGVMLTVASALLLALPGLVLLSAAGMACGFLLIAFAFFRAWAKQLPCHGQMRQEAVQVRGREVDEAPFEKVTNVVVERDVVGRLFGFGDVRFDTDGTAFKGVLFKGVKNPVEVKRRLKKQYVRRMAKAGSFVPLT